MTDYRIVVTGSIGALNTERKEYTFNDATEQDAINEAIHLAMQHGLQHVRIASVHVVEPRKPSETDKIARDLVTLTGYAWNAQEIGAQLDRGMICAAMHGGKWYRARRNGATKTWKTRPGEFRIPIKAGFKACGYIEHNNLQHFAHVDDLNALNIKHT